jgi:predicted hotdog family 3-hydroxylacyl-ACP dehydratase
MSVKTPHLPATRDEIAALVPHQMAMCLLEFVKEWTEDAILCGTRSHAFPDNPLRHHGRLAALHLCEYGAQAIAWTRAVPWRCARVACTEVQTAGSTTLPSIETAGGLRPDVPP